jgi:hypothetical protein
MGIVDIFESEITEPLNLHSSELVTSNQAKATNFVDGNWHIFLKSYTHACSAKHESSPQSIGSIASVSQCAMLFHNSLQAKVTYKVLLVTALAGYYLRISNPLSVCNTQDG